jgi:Tfp pilus assembly pilus retraction ATPase PilT
MQTLETSLANLIVENTITYEDAMLITAHPKELIRTLESLDKNKVPV